MKKKALSIILTAVMAVGMMTGCGAQASDGSSSADGNGAADSDFKVGIMYIGDENEGYCSTYGRY